MSPARKGGVDGSQAGPAAPRIPSKTPACLRGAGGRQGTQGAATIPGRDRRARRGWPGFLKKRQGGGVGGGNRHGRPRTQGRREDRSCSQEAGRQQGRSSRGRDAAGAGLGDMRPPPAPRPAVQPRGSEDESAGRKRADLWGVTKRDGGKPLTLWELARARHGQQPGRCGHSTGKASEVGALRAASRWK